MPVQLWLPISVVNLVIDFRRPSNCGVRHDDTNENNGVTTQGDPVQVAVYLLPIAELMSSRGSGSS
jgi:hypothetical protein